MTRPRPFRKSGPCLRIGSGGVWRARPPAEVNGHLTDGDSIASVSGGKGGREVVAGTSGNLFNKNPAVEEV